MAVVFKFGSDIFNSAGTNSKWPELEMGKNSVAPWIMPNRMASRNDIAAYCTSPPGDRPYMGHPPGYKGEEIDGD
jgi:hypothetical protein